MSSSAANVILNLGQIKLSQYRDSAIASGVALLLVYAINFIFQALITLFRTQNRTAVLRKLMETSQVLYWFGVASLFSVYPPFYYGVFNTIIGYITLIIVILLHIFCLVDKKASDRSLWSITYFIYHLLIMIWIVVGLVLAYIWSDVAYNTY